MLNCWLAAFVSQKKKKTVSASSGGLSIIVVDSFDYNIEDGLSVIRRCEKFNYGGHFPPYTIRQKVIVVVLIISSPEQR